MWTNMIIPSATGISAFIIMRYQKRNGVKLRRDMKLLHSGEHSTVTKVCIAMIIKSDLASASAIIHLTVLPYLPVQRYYLREC